MADTLRDQVWLPLLIGVAIQIVVAALYFLTVRIWNCLMQHIKSRTAVGESALNQPLPESDGAVAHAHDLEMGNGCGPAEGGQHTAEPELELGMVNGDEGD